MAIDPRNYDLDELRAASGAPRTADPETEASADADVADDGWPGDWHDGFRDRRSTSHETERPAADAAFEASVTRDLVTLDRGTDALDRPYLPALPATLPAELLIFDWLEFLLLQAGRESVADAIAFYESVGWIGTDAADALEAYLSGLDGHRANAANDLDADDHRVSLHYVARLASVASRE
ncbi:FlaD/FlaE family flagellar protein [Haloplanus salilacus]|uniref:FlaD/FlaE family flagellar protein n=1 Tax=Haloplanus salilacus TaxID=2949994 RepID=UPI0030CF5922